MELRAVALGPETLADFDRVHCSANGLDWCQCTAWWCEDFQTFGARSAGENRTHRQSLFGAGEFDGYLLYEGETPVGWSQVGPRDRLPNLVRIYGKYGEHGEAGESIPWAITCFALAPAARGRGLAERFLSLILVDLGRRGVGVVQAFPKREAKDPWTGPEAIYLRRGFTLLRDHAKLPVLQLKLD